jgi:hypothetical protein
MNPSHLHCGIRTGTHAIIHVQHPYVIAGFQSLFAVRREGDWLVVIGQDRHNRRVSTVVAMPNLGVIFSWTTAGSEKGAGQRQRRCAAEARQGPGAVPPREQMPPGAHLPDRCELPAAEAGDRRSARRAVSCAPGLREGTRTQKRCRPLPVPAIPPPHPRPTGPLRLPMPQAGPCQSSRGSPDVRFASAGGLAFAGPVLGGGGAAASPAGMSAVIRASSA